MSPLLIQHAASKGEVTAILGINQDKATGSDYYDLQGHKSSTNAKGIRIQNGKKTIIKPKSVVRPGFDPFLMVAIRKSSSYLVVFQ